MQTATLHSQVEAGLEAHGLAFQVLPCEADKADTAIFCEHYGYSPTETCNAIIVAGKSDPVKFACCIILANTKLDVNKRACQALEVKRASFANSEQTLQLTGMEIGGVTPFGLPAIPIFIDSAVMNNSQVVLGGGNRTSKVLLDPRELLKLPGAQVVDALAVPR